MPRRYSDQSIAIRPTDRAPDGGRAARQRVGAIELAAWLKERVPHFHQTWWAEIRARELGNEIEVGGVVDRMVRRLVGMLPLLLGAERQDIRPLWVRSCELFGVVAAKRGLAAGEVIEEFNVLRELLIRELYCDPPLGGRVPLSLGELLRLNRAIDRGLTHASVGHTDAMFFQLLRRDGDEHATTGVAVAQEAAAQLDVIGAELLAILGSAAPVSSEAGVEN